MLYPTKPFYHRLTRYWHRYMHWIGVSTWRCILGLYVAGVLFTFALWGFCKLVVLLIAYLLH